MSEIGVNFGGLGNTQSHVAQTATQMNQQLDELKRMLQPMVQTWTGSAAASYNEKQRRWDSAAANLNGVLAQIGKALANANDGYQQTESANANRFGG
ncbi:ESAT-6-like protein EsxA [Austwickia sp. TVS 96-490-7B]|uniref:WXG100 family type VII secretion target n=1 Tax=Austwickia sp. TVS 96-490-7B TaxID=2830843 RepID=UPI001C583409|nr:WXG100 family type VII secretion target [Austwickia sp. TVS 96-490-7B]MBW3086892.1 ESAT-6-like protein EsxA [Austwickia sp. TVS 96-490-7B]